MHRSKPILKLAALLVLIAVFFATSSRAQSIQGEWKITKLITTSATQEYTLTASGPEEHRNFGNHVKFNDDSTFNCWYSAMCGMDCFISSWGDYSLTDEDHVQFRIDTVSYVRFCEGRHKETEFPIETGLYYIQRSENEINFIKSNGDLEQDKLNISYSDTLDAHFEESGHFRTLRKWVKPKTELEITPENIASLYMSSIERSDYKVLYSKEIGYDEVVVLVEVDGEWKSIYCNTTLGEEKQIVYQVAMYKRISK